MTSKSLNLTLDGAPSISPAAARTTTVTGTAVDLLGFEGAEIFVVNGTITDGVFTYSLTECDTVGGTYTAVAAGDIVGTAYVSALTDDDTIKHFGYKGSKRFIKVVCTVSGTPSTGGVFAAFVVKGLGRHVTGGP